MLCCTRHLLGEFVSHAHEHFGISWVDREGRLCNTAGTLPLCTAQYRLRGEDQQKEQDGNHTLPSLQNEVFLRANIIASQQVHNNNIIIPILHPFSLTGWVEVIQCHSAE